MKLISLTSKCVSLALFVVVLSACSTKSPTESQPGQVALDKNTVADIFGNHDGVASSEEIAALDSYFSSNKEAWCLTDLGQESWYVSDVTAAQVRSYIASMATHPYPSEAGFRSAYQGENIRTPFVSVSVMRSDNGIVLVEFLRAPGPGISDADWEELPVKQ